MPGESESIAHDSVKRLLERQPHHTEALYNEAKRLIRLNEGVIVIDDSTLDKPYSHQIEMVTRHWSGKHHRVVQGINNGTGVLVSNPTGLWTRITRITAQFQRLTSLLKEELFICANMVSSKCSELFILRGKLNIGQPISLMHQNPIENRSRILDGTLRSTTEVLSNVAVLKNAKVVKKKFSEDIFFFRYSLLFALNLIG